MILNRSYISKNKDIFYSVAIGNFDGIHLGHRFILNQLKSCKKSNEDKIAVITFNPHPIKIDDGVYLYILIAWTWKTIH